MTMTDHASSTMTREPAAIDVAGLHEWVVSGTAPRLLDVRTPAEYTTAHIPGSANVPLDLLREYRHELGSHLDDDVVLVCRSGARATQASALLTEAGVANPRVLDGGVSAWESAGAPLNRGATTWELERQVRLVAGGLVLTGVLASTVLPWAKWLAAGIGGGLTFAAVTDSCAMGAALSRLPYNRRNAPALPDVVAELSGDDRG